VFPIRGKRESRHLSLFWVNRGESKKSLGRKEGSLVSQGGSIHFKGFIEGDPGKSSERWYRVGRKLNLN